MWPISFFIFIIGNEIVIQIILLLYLSRTKQTKKMEEKGRVKPESAKNNKAESNSDDTDVRLGKGGLNPNPKLELFFKILFSHSSPTWIWVNHNLSTT